MNKIFLSAILLFVSAIAHAQDLQPIGEPIPIPRDTVPLDKFTAGIGVGYEFGGGGANVLYYPTRNIGIFGGVGYNFIGVGYNAGIKIRYAESNSATVITPFVVAMYGYNTTVRYDNYAKFNKTFYNATIGGGVDFRPNKVKLGYFSLAILVPFRNPDVKNYRTGDNSQIYDHSPSNKLFPLSASFGYRFILF
jgi:hypothetical protein